MFKLLLMIKLDSFLLVFIILILYLILIFIAKSIGWKRKKTTENCTNACPKCYDPLNRISRSKTDHILEHCTFRVFNFKRYSCSECEWQGIRWENNFRKKN